MKVCFLVGTLGQGGAERQLFYMIQVLQEAGFESRVICLTKNEIYQTKIESLGIKVDFVGGSQSRFVRLLKIINNLRKTRSDIIQSSHFYTNIYAGIAGRLLKIKSIGAIRSDFYSEVNGDRIFGKWQIRLPEYLIANSLLAFNRAKDFGVSDHKINFVSNSVNLNVDNSKLSNKNKKELTIIFVGRLVSLKRPEIFVELAFYLKKKLPKHSFRFQMIGDGPLFNDLKTLAKNYQLSDKEFSFLGNQQNVTPFYQNASLLVLPSKFEGTPNVILEAMACGVPIVATKVGGIPEIVSDKCGILVEPENKMELFGSVESLILNDDLRQSLGDEGKKYIKNNHSLNSLKEQLLNVYKKIIVK